MRNSLLYRLVVPARKQTRLLAGVGHWLAVILNTAGAAAAVFLPDLASAASFVAKLTNPGLLEHVQSRKPAGPVINIGTLIVVEPATETPFPIQVAMGDGISKNSFVRIRGLPPSTALSEGHSIAPGAWAVPFVGLPTLRISVPVGVSGRSEIAVALVTIDGAVLAEAKTSLVIATASSIAPGQPDPQRQSVASISPAVTTRQGGGETAVPKPSTPVAPLRTEEQQRALRFVSKGHELLTEGDVATARLYYQRAVDAGLHEGALALAASYDPVELGRIGVKGLQPDADAARAWYLRAKQLGAPEAEERLNRLSAR